MSLLKLTMVTGYVFSRCAMTLFLFFCLMRGVELFIGWLI
jgi:hypothetical protein